MHIKQLLTVTCSQRSRPEANPSYPQATGGKGGGVTGRWSQLSGFFLWAFWGEGWQMWLQDDLKGKKLRKIMRMLALKACVSDRMKEEWRPLTLIRGSVCGITTEMHPTGNKMTCFQPIMERFKVMGQDDKHMCISPPVSTCESAGFSYRSSVFWPFTCCTHASHRLIPTNYKNNTGQIKRTVRNLILIFNSHITDALFTLFYSFKQK